MATTTPAAPAKSRIGLFITLGVILVIFLGARGTYNGMVTADETANEKWNNQHISVVSTLSTIW